MPCNGSVKLRMLDFGSVTVPPENCGRQRLGHGRSCCANYGPYFHDPLRKRILPSQAKDRRKEILTQKIGNPGRMGWEMGLIHPHPPGLRGVVPHSPPIAVAQTPTQPCPAGQTRATEQSFGPHPQPGPGPSVRGPCRRPAGGGRPPSSKPRGEAHGIPRGTAQGAADAVADWKGGAYTGAHCGLGGRGAAAQQGALWPLLAQGTVGSSCLAHTTGTGKCRCVFMEDKPPVWGESWVALRADLGGQ